MENKISGAAREFAAYLDTDDIICRIPNGDHDGLLKEMINRLAVNRGLDNADFMFDAVVKREKSGAIVIADAIAIPHARIPGIAAPIISIATSAKGVNFPDSRHNDSTVKLVILVLVPKDQPSIYLQILAAIGKIFENNPVDTAEKCVALETARDIENFFRRNGMILPDFICAADIMERPKDKLLDTNSLKDAIDMFVTRGLQEVPVIDKDGDMTGVVTAGALLKVCMPDYLLWMDDLSPILQFEPFVNVLRNEESTWLSDILRADYPSVQAGQPAIAVAEAMTKRNAAVCYVLEEKRLAGIITLPHFLDKVLRD